MSDRPISLPTSEGALAAMQKVLVFTLDQERFAADVAEAKEVLELSQITKVPYAPAFILGAMNLRGELLTVVDMRPLIGLPAGGRKEEAKVVVTDVTGQAIGLLADTVEGTLDISVDRIQQPLLTLGGDAERHVKGQIGLEDDILVLLDLERLLQCDEMNRLRGLNG